MEPAFATATMMRDVNLAGTWVPAIYLSRTQGKLAWVTRMPWHWHDVPIIIAQSLLSVLS